MDLKNAPQSRLRASSVSVAVTAYNLSFIQRLYRAAAANHSELIISAEYDDARCRRDRRLTRCHALDARVERHRGDFDPPTVRDPPLEPLKGPARLENTPLS